jgi:anaerobic magnesium-protoporphyrin IX monomethyl ester cyclase
MKRAGCEEIAIGIESGSEEVLKETEKGVTKDDMRRAAKWCHELGILFYGLAIVGLPGETEASVEDTISFIREIQPFYTQFSFCVPFPNTDTFQWYKEKGLLLTEDWSRYFPLDEKPVVRTLALSADDLVRLRRRMYLKTMLRPGNLLRAVRWKDWAWNIRNAVKLAARVVKLINGKAVR